MERKDCGMGSKVRRRYIPQINMYLLGRIKVEREEIERIFVQRKFNVLVLSQAEKEGEEGFGFRKKSHMSGEKELNKYFWSSHMRKRMSWRESVICFDIDVNVRY